MGDTEFHFGRRHQAKPNARCCGKPRGCNMPKDGCLYVVKRDRIEAGRDPALSVPDYRRKRGLCVTCGAGPCGSCACNHGVQCECPSPVPFTGDDDTDTEDEDGFRPAWPPLRPLSMEARTSPEMLAVLFNVCDLRRRVLSLQPATDAKIERYAQRLAEQAENKLRERFDL